ncbi:MAG: hypothetical protein SWY16_14155 [Cyanobacteriota bacterium]|nr:hypothetical protein [Cyanobacteriota bacterium]
MWGRNVGAGLANPFGHLPTHQIQNPPGDDTIWTIDYSLRSIYIGAGFDINAID